MQYPKAIGIAGLARCGKSTAGAYFEARQYFKLSFAQPLKEGLASMLGLTLDHLEGDLKECTLEPYGMSPRRMMQTLGTDWARDTIHPNIWVIRATQIVEEMRADDDDFIGPVVSDVRFENEAAWVREQGGRVIHLTRPDVAGIEAHASESGVRRLPGDYLVENDGTIEELHARLAIVLRGSPEHGRDNLS